jgi:hypothetical protein
LARRRVQLEGGFGALGGDQWVEQDQARVTLDDRQVGDVVVAHLVHALDDLEQAAMRAQLGLPPQG